MRMKLCALHVPQPGENRHVGTAGAICAVAMPGFVTGPTRLFVTSVYDSTGPTGNVKRM